MQKGNIVFHKVSQKVGTVVNVLTDDEYTWCRVRFVGNSKYNLKFIKDAELVKCNEKALINEIKKMIDSTLNAIRDSTESDDVELLVIRLHTEIDNVFAELEL